MTEDEKEIVWSRLQSGEYRQNSDGNIYDYESGEYICNISELDIM